MFKRILACLFVMALLLGCAHAEQLTDAQLVTFYDDALFVGDSVIRLLRNYVVAEREKDPSFFRDARFYSAYSYQLGTAAIRWTNGNRVNIQYRGMDVSLAELADYLKPGKLFILAGLNDRIAKYIERGMGYVEKIVELIRKVSPDTEIYFISITPCTAKENSKGYQDCINDYNAALEQKCLELNVNYIDVATDLKNENGVMDNSISSDGEYHLNTAGNALFVQSLLKYAQTRYDQGLWAPADGQ